MIEVYDLGPSFHIDLNDLKSKDAAICLGEKFRFTVLTERLIRMEYSETGTFNDLATQLVSFRNFDVPKFEKTEDANFLQIQTSYFKLFYTKNNHLKGSAIRPEQNLRVTTIDEKSTWYYGNPEVRNYYGNNISTETKDKDREKKENKGLYSLDGFVSFDDSDSLRINALGTIEKPIEGNVDVYLFIYGKDFGMCVQDYFKLTGNPALIPRYALGNWWCRDLPYNENDIKGVLNNFEKNDIPLSVLLLDKEWHIRNTDKYKNIDSCYKFNTELIQNPKVHILLDFVL